MKITAQEEYGIRCLLQLARAASGEVVSVKAIATKEGLSSAYVEKLLRILGHAGLVHSVRGIRGGYLLNRPPTEVTLGEAVNALGAVQTARRICTVFTGNRASCVHVRDCGIRSVWSGIIGYLQRLLDQTTLASLLEREYAVSERLAKQLHSAA